MESQSGIATNVLTGAPAGNAFVGRDSAHSRAGWETQFWFAKLLHPAYGIWVFMAALLVVYAVVPFAVYMTVLPEPPFLQLPILTCLAIGAMWVGSTIPVFDARFRLNALRLRISSTMFHLVTWVIFLGFVLVTFATAETIPIISALSGADPNTLSAERGAFLKGRTGPALALLYLSAFLTNTIVPYSVVLLFAAKSRYRHLLAAAFFLFCISFVQKALFLNLVLPLLAYFAISNQLHGRVVTWGLGGSLLVLLAGTYLSVSSEGLLLNAGTGLSLAEYMSAGYLSSNPFDYFIWRAVAVPIFTATDTLRVFMEQFGGQPLLGATSSLLSALTGRERINLERIVAEQQFGGWNDTANSNAVFITDAYVNFGYPGVLLFGLVVGQVFRWFRVSKDIGFQSLWPLFAFILFSASLIGMLLSNGFIYMLPHALFLVVAARKRRHA